MKTKYILWYIIALFAFGLIIGVIQSHAPVVDELPKTKAFHLPDVDFGPTPTSARPLRLPEPD